MTTGKRTLLLSKLRWLFSWRAFRSLIAVAILIALFYAEEDWRGKWVWEKYKREWEARGEHFDREAFIPPPITDDQNFTSIPFFAPLFDYQYDPARRADWMLVTDTAKWRDKIAYGQTQSLWIYDPGSKMPSPGEWQTGNACDLKTWQTYYRSITNFPVAVTSQDAAHDVLLALSKFDDILSEIRAASVRTDARFPIHYDEDMAARLPHIHTLRSISKILALRALAELNLGSNDQAFADINLCFRLTESIKSEPFLISQLVRIAMASEILQPVWEGLANHHWTDEQLKPFQQQLMVVDFLADSERSMKFERAEMNSTISELRLGTLSAHYFLLRYMVIDTLGSMEDAIKQPVPGERVLGLYLRLCPSGWLYLDQLQINRFYQDSIFPLVDVGERRVFPSQAQEVEEVQGRAWREHNLHRKFIGLIECGFGGGMVYKSAMGQTGINEAVIAYAPERYRLVHEQYPPTLEALAPQFIPRVSHDIVNGQPLSYQLTPNGRFVLSSAGWNDPSLGVPLKDAAHVWGRTGVWAWRYPAPNPPSN
jgi:hypothetical protein